MTAWVETKTNRFKAAVSGAGDSNWVSSLATTDIRAVFERYVGAPQDDPEIAFKGVSSTVDWTIKRSRLAELPSWRDMSGNPPVSTHQAISVAEKFLQSRLGSSIRFRLVNLLLYREHFQGDVGLPNPWVYFLSFSCDSPLQETERDLLGLH